MMWLMRFIPTRRLEPPRRKGCQEKRKVVDRLSVTQLVLHAYAPIRRTSWRYWRLCGSIAETSDCRGSDHSHFANGRYPVHP